MPVSLGKDFRTLDVLSWRGRPIVGNFTRQIPAPHTVPGCSEPHCGRGHYYRQQLQYLLLLGLIIYYEDKPQAFDPASGALDPGFLSKVARAYLPDDTRASFVNCPDWTNPHYLQSTQQCTPRNLGVFSLWVGKNEFEAEDRMIDFARLIQPAIAEAAQRVPQRFFLAYRVNLSRYQQDVHSDEKHFDLVMNSRMTVPRSTLLTQVFGSSYEERLMDKLPKVFEVDENGARNLLRELEDREVFMVADLELERSVSRFDPDLVLLDLVVRSIEMFQSTDLQRQVKSYRYE